MNKIMYKYGVFYFVLMAMAISVQANVVGMTGGQFRVDESGAATYNIPLSLPEGRAGVTPQLSLHYSSNNMMEGTVGIGWSVSGLSAIARCPQKPIHDNGHIQQVKYSSEDKFCLDGQRLLLESGTYGAPGSTYYTEVASMSTITAYGGSETNGPQYFEVKNKAGETHYYGNAGNANDAFAGHDAFVEPGKLESAR